MKTKCAILLYLIILTGVANAGDTVFITAPVTRSWNPQYMQRIFRDEFSGTPLLRICTHVIQKQLLKICNLQLLFR